MTENEFETAEDITGVNHAETVLDVGRDPTEREVRSAFKEKSMGSDGEEYWKLVKAREIAIAKGVINGTATYKILRQNPRVDDIYSLAQAEKLLQAQKMSPGQVGSSRYNRIIRKTHKYIQNRLEDLMERGESSIDSQTVQAIEICYHSLRFQDLEKGKRWVIGDQSKSDENELITGWKYSLDLNDNSEYYTNQQEDLIIMVTPIKSESKSGYEVSVTRDGVQLTSKIHSRYGNAKRQVRRWMVEGVS
ncbi:hypothetical protein Natpe_4107 (plasmid) [Natrinema pellirubrum DSM 15624]|uniref:Uncharacterized protein n=1 Tax=Natrinema pellirubrum (strain DSM 15624 / CIP 106293 / JCM 10476 / NCIMB 786 / 157) TaxID=797303 RepID=L0JTX6_NATP1|nr:hypothetical protein [Natrinema pellirubrum]AGB33826.1 hypothetical protein Natpe_4107 [Natrinema pellirubrum DSM 15624]